MLNHLSELEKNLETRRLLIVILHIAVPTAFLVIPILVEAGLTNPALSKLSQYSPALFAVMVLVISVLVGLAVVRCHHGNVINGSMVEYTLYKEKIDSDLNWIGISLCFYIMCVLSLIASVSAIVAIYMNFGGIIYFILFLVAITVYAAIWYFKNSHDMAVKIAIAEVDKLEPNSSYTYHQHCDVSLKESVSDISVIVILAMTVFATLISFQTELLSLDFNKISSPFIKRLVTSGPPYITVYGVALMILSQIMIIRLRIAIAYFVSKSRDDKMKYQVWHATFYELKFLIYCVVMFLAMFLMFLTLFLYIDFYVAIISVAAYCMISIWLYFSRLEKSRQKHFKEELKIQ